MEMVALKKTAAGCAASITMGVESIRNTRRRGRMGSREWVAAPIDVEGLDATLVAETLQGAPEIRAAWIVGSRRSGDHDDTMMAVALVVAEPEGAMVQPAIAAAVDGAARAFGSAGIEIETWAFVPQLTVDREIEHVGARLYERK